MLIQSPQIVDRHMKSILLGKFNDSSRLRDDLARKYKADKICPLTTGIFLWIVSEAYYKEYKADAHENNITSF